MILQRGEPDEDDDFDGFMELCAMLGDVPRMTREVEKGASIDSELPVRLVLSGNLASARKLFELKGKDLRVYGRWSDALDGPVEKLLASFEDPELACLAAFWFYRLDDASRAAPPKSSEIQRLLKLADWFKATTFRDAEIRELVTGALYKNWEAYQRVWSTENTAPKIEQIVAMLGGRHRLVTTRLISQQASAGNLAWIERLADAATKADEDSPRFGAVRSWDDVRVYAVAGRFHQAPEETIAALRELHGEEGAERVQAVLRDVAPLTLLPLLAGTGDESAIFVGSGRDTAPLGTSEEFRGLRWKSVGELEAEIGYLDARFGETTPNLPLILSLAEGLEQRTVEFRDSVRQWLKTQPKSGAATEMLQLALDFDDWNEKGHFAAWISDSSQPAVFRERLLARCIGQPYPSHPAYIQATRDLVAQNPDSLKNRAVRDFVAVRGIEIGELARTLHPRNVQIHAVVTKTPHEWIRVLRALSIQLRDHRKIPAEVTALALQQADELEDPELQLTLRLWARQTAFGEAQNLPGAEKLAETWVSLDSTASPAFRRARNLIFDALPVSPETAEILTDHLRKPAGTVATWLQISPLRGINVRDSLPLMYRAQGRWLRKLGLTGTADEIRDVLQSFRIEKNLLRHERPDEDELLRRAYLGLQILDGIHSRAAATSREEFAPMFELLGFYEEEPYRSTYRLPYQVRLRFRNQARCLRQAWQLTNPQANERPIKIEDYPTKIFPILTSWTQSSKQRRQVMKRLLGDHVKVGRHPTRLFENAVAHGFLSPAEAVEIGSARAEENSVEGRIWLDLARMAENSGKLVEAQKLIARALTDTPKPDLRYLECQQLQRSVRIRLARAQ